MRCQRARWRTDKVNFIWNFPLFSIVLSLFSGPLCFMLSGKAAKRYTIIYELTLVVMCAAVLGYVLQTGQPFTYVMGEFPAPWGNEIRAGVLEALFALCFMIIMLASVVGGFQFVKQDIDESKINLYYALINLMTAAIMALLWTNDIFTGYVFLEILTLTSCGISVVREMGRTTLAAVRYMILNLVGSGLFLLGVVLFYDLTGHLLMVPMQAAVAELAQDPQTLMVMSISLGVLTIGLAIKSGLFPFHFWMPDTYGFSTPTSASILSSLVSKAYILLLFKIYYRCIGIEVFEIMPIRNILLILGICGMVFGSISAMHANTVNRMVAFSSAAQIGYIYMGFGIGGEFGYVAALFHILAHAFTKSLLFLTTPRLADVSGGSAAFKNLQGSGMRDRHAGIAFIMGAFSMIGIPGLAGFCSKMFFGLAGVRRGDNLVLVLVMLALAASSLLNAIYFIRTCIRIYTEPAQDAPWKLVKAQPIAAYDIPMIVLITANLVLGLLSTTIINLIQQGLSMFG